MIRGTLLGLAAAAFGTAAAAEQSPPLALETARMVLAAAGINPGKVFAIGEDRYVVDAVEVRGGADNFSVHLRVRPLQRRKP